MEQSSSSDFILPADSTQLSTAYTDLTVVSSQGYSCLVKAKRSGRWWMLKGLKPDFRNQLIYQELLQKEYKMMAPLQHPNIVNTMNREQVDGLGWFHIFLSIDTPLARSGVAATAVFCAINSWNEFLMALILTGRNTTTMPVAIPGLLTPQGTIWGQISAVGTVITIPVLVFAILVQKHMISGMTMGAVK